MRISKILCLILMTFAVSSEVGCRPEQQAACKEFFSLSLEQQEKVFSTFPLDHQLTIYRCAMNRRPPEIALAYEIAKGGEKILPELTEALRSEKDESMQNALIYIFRGMSIHGYLRGKPLVIQQIRDTVSRMKTARIKEEAKNSLHEIEKNSSRVDN